MSIVRIFFNPLNGADREEHQVDAGIQIIDFLQEHFPSGFDGHLRVFVGVEEIQIEDLDRVIGEDELVTLLVMPTGAETWAAIAAYDWLAVAINAAIAVAIGFTIQLLFPPSVPGAAKNQKESPVYSLNASSNTARLGDPISAHYGTVSFPPDYASAPYYFYDWDSNSMYVDELLCMGHGDFDISEIFVGDTPISSIEPGSIRVWKFGPNEHKETMGVISDTILGQIDGSEIPFPFMENVITSPEVESYVFGDNSDPVTIPTPFAGRAFGEAYDPVKKQNTSSYISNVDSALGFTAGDLLTLAGTVSNNGTFTIGSVVPDPNNAAICTVYPTSNSPIKFQDEDPLSGGTTFTLNTQTDYLIAGPYRSQKLGQVIDRIDCDIIFARGLYRVDGTSGKFKTNSVTMEFTYQMIDENTGDPINAPIVYQHTFTSKKRQTLRATISSNAIPPGAYEVSVKRITPIPDDDRKYDEVTWAGLKGKIVNSTERTYGPVSLLAIRMKATNGLGAAARERIRVTATRRLPSKRNPERLVDTTNPIAVIIDIWTSKVYGLGRSESELDLATLYDLALQWDAEDGPKFNGSFDQRGTGFEALQSVMSSCGGKIVQNGGLTTVAIDKVQPVRTAMFTSANIVRGSMEIQYSFDTTEDYNGVTIEYRDPKSFQPAFVTYPETATLPDTFILFGCTDSTYAMQYATYLYNVQTKRRKQIKFTTELDGLIPRFGDRIGISHPLPSWGHSGVIIDVIDATTFRVDTYLDWTPGEHMMMLRSNVGAPSSQYIVTRGDADNVVVFPEVPDVEVNDPEGMEPTSYVFGTATNMVKDFILSKVTPKGDTTVEIEGQTYAATIYTGGPPHMSY